MKYVDYLLSEPSHQPSHRMCVELRSTHQANHVIVSCSPSKQMGLDISALLKRCIVSGTGSTGYIEYVSMVAMYVTSGQQPIGAAQPTSQLSTMT